MTCEYVFVLGMNGISVNASTHLREYLKNMNYESRAVHKITVVMKPAEQLDRLHI